MKKGFLRRLWHKNAPWPIKVMRTGAISLAGIACLPFAFDHLPGEPLPETYKKPLKDFYQATLNYDDIKIHSSAIGDFILRARDARAITFKSTIFISCKSTIFISRADQKLLKQKNNEMEYILAHELAHVRQFDRGLEHSIISLQEKFSAFSSGNEVPYAYSLRQGKDWRDYGTEQQASILADYYNITKGRVPHELTDEVAGAERLALYKKVLAPFLKERAAANPSKDDKATVPPPSV